MSMPSYTLLLIGLRGSGKTTVGRLLAAALGRPFIDLDDVTPSLMGHRTVAEAWNAAGQTGFRRAEAQALRAVLPKPGQVVALGGGTPTAPGVADLLGRSRKGRQAVIIYLRATPKVLRSRLAAADNAHRPPLTAHDADPLSEIETVYAQRDALYVSLADHVIETDKRSAKAAAQAIAAVLKESSDRRIQESSRKVP